jgi:hypothetical protein
MAKIRTSKRVEGLNLLSRSKLELFTECPRCFYANLKLGIKRPPSFPLSLNNAVDALFKKEFDQHRAASLEEGLEGMGLRGKVYQWHR